MKSVGVADRNCLQNAIGSLGTPDQFKTLRADANGVTLSEGPYAATSEPFGAFFIVEAESIDEAVEIARLHPGTHLGHMMKGGIEVRPIDQVEQPCPAKQGDR